MQWYGIWWVILLQYTHVVYTSMAVLNCPTLPDLDGELAAVSNQHEAKAEFSSNFYSEMVCEWWCEMLPWVPCCFSPPCYSHADCMYCLDPSDVHSCTWQDTGELNLSPIVMYCVSYNNFWEDLDLGYVEYDCSFRAIHALLYSSKIEQQSPHEDSILTALNLSILLYSGQSQSKDCQHWTLEISLY